MLTPQRAGPLERTVVELHRLEIEAGFRRGRVERWRRRMQESDSLIGLVEECRLRGFRLLPTQLWTHIARFTGSVDPRLREELGADRRPDLATDILFSAQSELLEQAIGARRPALAPIIPLFGRAPQVPDARVS